MFTPFILSPPFDSREERQEPAGPGKPGRARAGNMDARTRVACMGDSITRGNASHEPGENGTHRPHKPKIANRGNFPLELQRLMGANWDVRNFGHGGRSVVGASAYDKTAEFERACRFAPAVVLLMLGTNDAKVCPSPPTAWLWSNLTATPTLTRYARRRQRRRCHCRARATVVAACGTPRPSDHRSRLWRDGSSSSPPGRC